ncbi:hypothetical protein SNEBB_005362 [Seison nebaliae]|nr:hypothetical protein SNEBB_005362 [Seison nebaliae]
MLKCKTNVKSKKDLLIAMSTKTLRKKNLNILQFSLELVKGELSIVKVDICELVVDRTMGPNRGTSDAYRHRSRCGDGSKNNTARNKEKQRMKRRKANRLGLPSPLVFKQSNGSYNHSR